MIENAIVAKLKTLSSLTQVYWKRAASTVNYTTGVITLIDQPGSTVHAQTGSTLMNYQISIRYSSPISAEAMKLILVEALRDFHDSIIDPADSHSYQVNIEIINIGMAVPEDITVGTSAKEVWHIPIAIGCKYVMGL